jgi:hypothetical protein
MRSIRHGIGRVWHSLPGLRDLMTVMKVPPVHPVFLGQMLTQQACRQPEFNLVCCFEEVLAGGPCS